MVKEDCLAHMKNRNNTSLCVGLRYLMCEEDNRCPFYKSNRYFEQDGTLKKNISKEFYKTLLKGYE